MSAVRLREAAKVLRWRIQSQPVCDHYCRGCQQNATDRALADWLDATAVRIEAGRDPKDGGRRNHGWRGSREALAVANAILGGA